MAIITCIESVGNKIWATCRGCESHIQLRGMGPGGVLWTRIACPYWPKWARSVVSAWSTHLRPILLNYGEFGPPTLFVPSCGEDSFSVIREINSSLSKAMNSVSVATALEAQRQPAGRLPQLIPDGLPPDVHQQAALALQHPFAIPGRSTHAVTYACKHSADERDGIGPRRESIIDLVEELTAMLREDNERVVAACAPTVRKVLKSGRCPKNIALMRELGIACRTSDFGCTIGLVLGLPMIGPTERAPGLMTRIRPAEVSVKTWSMDRLSNNMKAMSMVKPNDEASTDIASWDKSLAELKRGIIEGPFEMEKVPFDNPVFVPRVGIWEMHGTSTVPNVRNIDNLLVTGHNATVATFAAHRPTDADALLGQARCVREYFPNDDLAGWPSDYEKAFKQVPGCPKQVEKLVLLQWNPHAMKINAWVAFSQLFGEITTTEFQ